MLKLIGCICLVASSSLAGISLSLRLKEQYLVSKSLCEMFSMIEVYLQNEYLTADEVVERLSRDFGSDKLSFLKNAGNAACIADKIKAYTIIPVEQRERIAGYFKDFGRCDITGEAAKIRLIQKENEYLTKKLGERCDKNCRLYSVLGVLIGIAVTLILI